MIDENISNIILGVTGNILTSFLYITVSKTRYFFGSENTQLRKRKKTLHPLEPILSEAIRETFENIEWNGSDTDSEICIFLKTPEVEGIVRQIYSNILIDGHNSIQKIQQEFSKLLILHVNIERNEAIKKSRYLLSALVASCNAALKYAIENGTLAAHEATSTLRHQILMDQLSTINRNLEYLTSSQKINIVEILRFETEFRTQVATRHGYITPPFVDATKKIPIDDIFVSPHVISNSKKKNQESNPIQSIEFISKLYRAVLLGNPGGGKSTFTLKLCYDLATNYEKRLLGNRLITPILVTLRDFGSQKKESGLSILEFIEKTSKSHYQIEPPKGAFEYLLLNERVVVIFDGLDELLDTSYRQEISSDVETFCSRYPSVPVLVTSREVGYEQAPLDSSRFEIVRLAAFSDEQVREYVAKWFKLESDLSKEQQQQQTRSFLRESQNVPDLRSNPLMLALMCNIYRGENYIPKNRPEVYQRCATMLFERWDKSRNIITELPFEEHIRPAMAHLAYWIYSKSNLHTGVTETRLINRTTEYLMERRFENRHEAEQAAEQFITFCRGRAWVFTDTGTTAEGERLYQFTHQTFLEYFTADYIVRTHATSVALVNTLLPKIFKREWDIVTQLVFQMHNRRLEGGGDELILEMTNRTNDSSIEEKWNSLSFSARSLEFIIPKPSTTRKISTAIVAFCLQSAMPSNNEEEESYLSGSARYELFSYLLSSANENRSIVADSLEKLLVAKIGANEEQQNLAADLVLYLSELPSIPIFSRRSTNREPTFLELRSEVRNYWIELSNRIYTQCYDQFMKLAKVDLGVCYEMYYKQDIDLESMVNWHGIRSIFQNHQLDFPGGRLPIAHHLILYLNQFFFSDVNQDKNYQMWINHQLKVIADTLINSETPWIQETALDSSILFFFYLNNEDKLLHVKDDKYWDLNSDEKFGLFCIFAIIAENETFLSQMRTSRRNFIDIIDTIKKPNNPVFGLKSILIAWLENHDNYEPIEDVSINFSDEQYSFIRKWIRREINLVHRTKKRLKSNSKSSNQTP